MYPYSVKYLICILLLTGAWTPYFAAAQLHRDTSAVTSKDTALVTTDTVSRKKKVPKPPYLHQLRVGADISRIAFNLMYKSKKAYEFQADYALRGKLYIAAEAGFGKGKVDFDNLKYSTDGAFIRLGVDNSILDRLGATDFDMAFIGARYGIGIGNRSEAHYKVPTIFGSGAEGVVPASNYTAHWGEILGGIKVEIWKGVFAGWSARAKFLFNSGSFKELAPSFIPGYGPGDKSTAFDFNMYLSYTFRWLAPKSRTTAQNSDR